MAGETVSIKLGGKRGGEMIVDAKDSDLGDMRWCQQSAGYACRRTPGSQSHLTLAHRVIAERVAARTLAKGEIVDHINHDTLDNRRDNLRVVTHRQNVQHRFGAQKNSRSGHRGVWWHKGNRMWVAMAWTGGQFYLAGYFHSIDEAVKAVRRKRSELGFLGSEHEKPSEPAIPGRFEQCQLF